MPLPVLAATLLAAALLSAALIVALKPFLLRYALARPNARSSHKAPTPQGGGIAVVAAGLCGALVGFAPFNRPVARLFLGDVGSLPIGLLVGWLLVELAAAGA